MSIDNVVFTDFEANLKGYGIEITASARDGVEAKIFVDGADLREFYELNPASFLDKYGDSAATLQELFTSVKGLQITNP